MFGTRLSRFVSASLFACLCFAADRPVAAQLAEGDAPEIRGVLVNSDAVLDRLQMVLGLTTPEEQKQHDTLKDFIEVFLIGVDRTKPVRLDVLTGGEETTSRLDVPIDQRPGEFANVWKLNLVPLGIPVREFVLQPGLYKLGGSPADAFTGFMIYDAKERGGYATIVEDAKFLPGKNAPAPPQGVQALLGAGFDAAVHLTNKPGGVDARHEHFAKEREKVLDKLKKDVDESASDFELRKFAAGVQFDQSQRIYAEAKDLLVGLKVSPQPAQATASVRLEPLPGTQLAGAVELLGTKASRFAGIPRGEGDATSGRVNFPFDEFRKKNFLALSQKIRETELEEIETEEDRTPEQKQATREFLTGLFDLLDEGIEAGILDGFLEMAKGDDGKYNVVGGLKSPDATKWVPVLSLIPKLNGGAGFKQEVGEHAGFAIHEIAFNKEEHPDFLELFGSERLLIATGPDALWYAAGPKADELLRQSIDQAASEGEPSPEVVSFRGELLPGLRILHRRLGSVGHEKIRNLAIQAFQEGGGRITAEVVRKGAAIDGELVLGTDLLRFIGKALADFSKENLALLDFDGAVLARLADLPGPGR